MLRVTRSFRGSFLAVVASCGLACVQSSTFGQNVVPLSLNGLFANNVSGSGQTNWGGFGAFDYGSSVVGAGPSGPYSSFSFVKTAGGGSGTGWTGLVNADAPYNSFVGTPILGVNSADFAVFDRAAFGTNFDADDYVIEVVYKPGPTNVNTSFNINLTQHDGFAPDPNAGDTAGQTGKRVGEQLQWGFTNIVDYYNNNPHDAGGFVSISQPLTDGLGGNHPGFNGPSFSSTMAMVAFRMPTCSPATIVPTLMHSRT